MNKPSTESIVERLQEAAAAIERSTRDSARSLKRQYRDSAGDTQTVLSREWESLKSDLTDLMSNADISNSPEARAVIDKMRTAVTQASDRLGDMAHQARRQAAQGVETVDGYVRESPWATAGVAALTGLVIGLLLAQSNRR